LYEAPPKYELKKFAKLGTPEGAVGAPTTFNGLGGAKRIGELIWNLFISGCSKKPLLLTHPPLNGCPATKVG